MIIANTIAELRKETAKARAAGKRIGFVPTMGYLHEGHLSLVEISKRQSDYQVMSIFVNKIQFNDRKDYDSYPRELERDFAMARAAGVELMFTPDDGEMYHDQLTFVDVESLTGHLCGAHRPGHFRGVYTVVSKLFNIVQPDVSVFGQKDIQQAATIEKMVADLNFPVKIVIAPIIREEGGLAMSSRNKHLTPELRTRALSIHRGLAGAEALIAAGERRGDALVGVIRKELDSGKPDSIDYISLVSYATLQPVSELREKSVIAVAAFFGTTRLIDNMVIEKEGGSFRCVY
ncbi:MAG: pantoate--beta-alanine ligase [Spirochaetes bacterium]|nr:pantoate--beta-alanine ligase [Spirochaetota bacterium]